MIFEFDLGNLSRRTAFGVLWLSLVLGLAAIGSGVYANVIVPGWNSVTATVVKIREIQWSSGDDAGYSEYCPTVNFTSPNGLLIEADLTECSNQPDYVVGSRVNLFTIQIIPAKSRW